jgi:hypothetical protein
MVKFAWHVLGFEVVGSTVFDLIKVCSVFDNNPHNWKFYDEKKKR